MPVSARQRDIVVQWRSVHNMQIVATMMSDMGKKGPDHRRSE